MIIHFTVYIHYNDIIVKLNKHDLYTRILINYLISLYIGITNHNIYTRINKHHNVARKQSEWPDVLCDV